MSVIVADVPEGHRLGFYRHGALLVSGAGFRRCRLAGACWVTASWAAVSWRCSTG